MEKTIKKNKISGDTLFYYPHKILPSFFVHRYDDRISCIYFEKLWRAIEDIIIRRA